MLASPEALSAVRKEAEGLEKAGTWDLNSVWEQADVCSEAKKTGISVHFGQFMTIASVKFFELAKHLQKMNGRIVYRGDCAKDEYGSAAAYQELGANPTSVQGLNACIAYMAACQATARRPLMPSRRMFKPILKASIERGLSYRRNSDHLGGGPSSSNPSSCLWRHYTGTQAPRCRWTVGSAP